MLQATITEGRNYVELKSRENGQDVSGSSEHTPLPSQLLSWTVTLQQATLHERCENNLPRLDT